MVFFMLQIQLLFVFLHSKMKKSMKKVYSIALLAIIMIVCLQGYNMHLQYQVTTQHPYRSNYSAPL